MELDLLKKLEPFFHQYKPLNYKKGHIILRPEDSLDNIYFLEKGYVKFYSLSEDGRELTYLIYKPGYLFPVIYTFLGEKNKYYFEALTPVVLRRAPREVFTNIVVKDQSLAFYIGQEIVTRLVELMDRMQNQVFGNASHNVAYILLLCAEQFGAKKGNKASLKVPLVHKDIAAMAGLTRETVSIEMKRLQNNKLISYKRNSIFIKDMQKFKKEAIIDTEGGEYA